jgi:hypothetical protein
MKYILAKEPDFVVLRGAMREDRPYLEAWLNPWRFGQSLSLGV